MRNDKENIIVNHTFQFALKIIEFTENPEEKRKYNMANQLFRSGTSIGANMREAQNAESKNDFIHKMKMAAKEADETHYWLDLCKNGRQYPDRGEMLAEIEIIEKILSKIISSSKTYNRS